MQLDSKIFVAGHGGMVGSAILSKLQKDGFTNIITRTHSDLDLTNQKSVQAFFEAEEPEYVFLAAAKVGGISANNTYRAEFIYENIMIQSNVIHQSYLSGVKKLLFIGSTCIYPKESNQPIKEDYLLTGALEYTNEPYAIAKIAGIKMCESYNVQYGTNFISVMPTNLYGPNDNFNIETSHVIPALIRKIYLAKCLNENNHEAVIQDLNLQSINQAMEYMSKHGVDSDSVEIWGTGNPLREFLWVEDMADACIYIMKHEGLYNVERSSQSEIRNTHINIGTGHEVSIKDLAETIKEMIGYKGKLVFNSSKPDGTMRKLTDVSKLHNLGWKHKIELKDGIRRLYEWYLSNR